MLELLGSSYVVDSVALVLLRRLENDPRTAELGRSMLLKRLVTEPCTGGSVDGARCCVTVDCRSVGTCVFGGEAVRRVI